MVAEMKWVRDVDGVTRQVPVETANIAVSEQSLGERLAEIASRDGKYQQELEEQAAELYLQRMHQHAAEQRKVQATLLSEKHLPEEEVSEVVTSEVTDAELLRRLEALMGGEEMLRVQQVLMPLKDLDWGNILGEVVPKMLQNPPMLWGMVEELLGYFPTEIQEAFQEVKGLITPELIGVIAGMVRQQIKK